MCLAGQYVSAGSCRRAEKAGHILILAQRHTGRQHTAGLHDLRDRTALPGCDRDPFVYSSGSDLVYFFIGSERRGFQQRHGERAEQHCGEQQRERLFELHFVFPPRFLFPIWFSSIVSISQRLKRMQYEKL